MNPINPHEGSYKALTPEFWFNKVQWDIDQIPDEKRELLSDGYHTFKELYIHRVVLFVALCNTLNNIDGLLQADNDRIKESKRPWKSKLHFDGTMWEGWFIAGIGTQKGETLTYHLPISEWDNFNATVLENAPEWDGHTADDVLRLLSSIHK